MGNCRGKVSKTHSPPTRGFEEHTIHRHQLRLGLQGGKDEKGQIIVGFKGGIDNYSDTIVKVEDIPKVLDLVQEKRDEQQDFKIQKQNNLSSSFSKS